MLNMKCVGEIVALTPNVEYHGDDVVKSVSVKVLLKDVPLAVVEDGLVSQMSLFYTRDDALKLADIEPEFSVTRTVENVTATIGGLVLKDMRVRKARVKLREKRLADVTLFVQGHIVSGMDKLHNVLRQRTDVELVEGDPLADQRAA